jgi:hypothetical protein
MYNVAIYEKIPNIIENSHSGIIVFSLYPIPNTLIDPLCLKRNCGLVNTIATNAIQ